MRPDCHRDRRERQFPVDVRSDSWRLCGSFLTGSTRFYMTTMPPFISHFAFCLHLVGIWKCLWFFNFARYLFLAAGRKRDPWSDIDFGGTCMSICLFKFGLTSLGPQPLHICCCGYHHSARWVHLSRGFLRLIIIWLVWDVNVRLGSGLIEELDLMFLCSYLAGKLYNSFIAFPP